MPFRPTRNPDKFLGVKANQTLSLAEIARRRAAYVPPTLPTATTSAFFGALNVDPQIAERTAAARQRALGYVNQYRSAFRPGPNMPGVGGRGRRQGMGTPPSSDKEQARRLAEFYSRRDGISKVEAERRMQAASRLTSQLKGDLRRAGLYAGDMSGKFDPLLANAVRLDNASNPEEQASAISAYRLAADQQNEVSRTRIEQQARKAQISARRDGFTKDRLKAALGLSGGLDKETLDFIDEAQRLLADPRAYKKNPDGVIHAVEVLNSLQESAKDAQPKGLGEHLLHAGGKALAPLSVPMEQLLLQPYYAATHARDKGGGTGRQVNSFLSSLPGLGFIAGGASQRDRAETDSLSERAALTEAGQLQSFGQNIAGHNRILSGLADLTLQVVGDPLNALTPGLGRLGRVGEVALGDAARSVAREEGLSLLRAGMSDTDNLIDAAVKRAVKKGVESAPEARARITQAVAERAAMARTNFLAATQRGRSLTKAAEDVVAKNFDAASIKKAIPGLDQRVAQAMAEASSREEALAAFQQAFVTGEYSPSISIRRQLLGTKGITAPGGVGLGKKVIREREGLFDVLGFSRRAVRGNAIRSVTRTTQIPVLAYNTLRTGLARAEERLDDVYAKIAPEVVGLDPVARLDRVWEKVETVPALSDLFEKNLDIVEKQAFAGLGQTTGLGLKAVDQALNSEVMEAFLKQMEVIAYLSEGKAGDAAQKQVLAEAQFGLGRKFKKDGRLLTDAIEDAASPLPGFDPTPLSRPEHVKFLNARVTDAAKNGLISPRVEDALKREISRTAGLKSNKLNSLERRINAALKSDVVSDSFNTLLRNRDELVGVAEDAADPVGLMRRLVNQPLKLVNSLAEPVSPAHVAFLGYTNEAHAIAQRVEDVDRWARKLGLDDFDRKLLGDSVARVKAEEDLFSAVDTTLRALASKHGLPAELLTAIQTEGVRGVKDGSNKMTFARVADGLVKTDDSVYTLAQRGELVYLPDPDDVRRTIREFKAFEGDLGARVRVGLSKVPDLGLFGLHGPVTGDRLTIRNFLAKGHTKWKYVTVIPGADLAALGAVVGFAATDGDTGDRLKGAAQGASIGLLTPLRYIVRVAGIEEGMRKYLAGGLNAEMWKPHLSRTATQRGLDRPFTLTNAVKAGDPIGTSMDRLLATAMDEFDAISPATNPIARIFRKDSRFLEGYGRILNNQIHPETDYVAEMLLRRQAGEITAEEALDQFGQFVATDAGKLWMRRLKGAVNGPKNAEEALARYDNFIVTYAGDAEIARARLDAAREYAATGVKADVPRDVIKAAQRRGNALPEVIHAEKTFTIPKNFKQVAQMRDRITSKVFEGPTTSLNRAPMARSFYRDEYTRLLRNGVSPERAQEVAEQIAVEKTNRIMFRISDESRFASKADFVFPFQQPREELLRVWAPLIASNPARAMHMTRLASLAFNNGKDKGMFTQDRFGEWRMTVPGSAYISKLLFNSGSAFDFRLQDLVFFGQGAYGVNIIPSPGGPYWGLASRLFINRNPEWFEGLSKGTREWLFPYGATGRIFRPEVSRMWMAWTGDVAPFEFGSKQEQENALNKHRIEVYLQLIWQHGKETGDWSYRPSDQEWDDAVSASLKSWAFIGAFFPAGPALLRPDQKAVDALKQQYTVNGEFDFISFSNDNPKFAPWLVGMTETVDDSFEAWSRTMAERSDDTLLHRRTTKDSRAWRRELAEREAESKAYKELADIQSWPATMQGDLYAAWDKKYPDLAQSQQDNYQRDIELMHIEGTLAGKAKEDALDRWRKRYDVTFPNYQRLADELHKGTLRNEYNPWDMARDTEAVVAEVNSRLRRTQYAGTNFESQFAAEQVEVSRLPVAEQARYWDWRLSHFNYDWTDDPQLIMDRYYLVKQHRSALWQTAPMKLQLAMSDKKKDKYAAAIEEMESDWREQISNAYNEAGKLDAVIKDMAAKKQWGSKYNALKARRTELYDLATAIKDKWYKGVIDVNAIADDVRSVMIFSARGDFDSIRKIMDYRKEHDYFVTSDEQSSYLSMPAPVQDAFVENLVTSLDIPPGEFREGKKFWEWLTEFQQDLLTKNMPKDKIDQWKGESPDSGGRTGRGGRRGGGYYGNGSGVADELSYAYAMFKKYNKRGGAKPPAAYKEYLSLPNDAALRSAFLKLHPEVQDYIKLGPMANMPPALSMIVADIMIRNGKWEGESRSMTEISEIGFAREMMARWSRRGDRTAPAVLQTWLDMPTGAAKAQYLRDHPEIGEWMQLGPMANMPEAYREVVRDIMFRYGMWTDSQDPLGKTISGYFSAPSYARDQYLLDHPELTEYWKATRSVEEQAQYAQADQYFSLKDPNAKRAYLQIHPELQEWFLNQRQKRYETFLNQVAVYMGANPEMFTAYLDRQEAVLADLLNKFSEPPIMRERFIMRDQDVSARSRVRAA